MAESKIEPTKFEQPDFIPEDQFVSDEDSQGGILEAALAGAARGASFGTSDVALTVSKKASPETLKRLKEEYPITSTVSELGTVLGLSLVSGGAAGVANLPRLASKMGASVEQKAIAKGLQVPAAKAAGTAAEGAVYGLGQSVSESALGDHDLVSEKTLANIGMSAALSGGISNLVSKMQIQKVAREEARAAALAEEKLAAHKLSQTAESPVEQAIANSGMTPKEKVGFFQALEKEKANADEIRLAGQLIDAPVMPGQVSDSRLIQDAESALSHMPDLGGELTRQTLKKGFDSVDNVLKTSLGSADEVLKPYDAGAKIKTQINELVDNMYKPFKAYYAEREALGTAIDLSDKFKLSVYEDLLDKSKKFGAVGSAGSKAMSTYADRVLEQQTLGHIDSLITEVNAAQRVAYRAGDTTVAKALGETSEALKEHQIKQLILESKQLEKAGIREAKEAADETIKLHKEITKQYKEFKQQLNELVSDQRLGGRKDVTATQLENILDGIPNEKVIEKMFDPRNADGLKRLKTKFPEVFKTLVDQKKGQILSESLEDGRVQIGKVMRQLYDEKKMSSKVRELIFNQDELNKLNASKIWVEALPKNINPSGTAKTLAYMEFLGNPIKASVQNFKGYVTRKLIDKFAPSTEVNKINSLVETQRAEIKTTNKIKAGVKSLFSDYRTPIAKVSSMIDSPDDYKKKTEEIRLNANNPNYLMEKISKSTEDLYEHAPLISQSMQTSMMRGLTFLSTKIPEDTTLGFFPEQKEPSKTEISKFNRYYTVVENPLEVLEQVKDGTFSLEAKETLEAVYPRLYQDMKQHLVEGIVNLKKKDKVPYHVKLSISRFLGQPTEESMLPQQIASFQRQFASVNQQQQVQQQMATKPSTVGMREITKSDRLDLDRYGKG